MSPEWLHGRLSVQQGGDAAIAAYGQVERPENKRIRAAAPRNCIGMHEMLISLKPVSCLYHLQTAPSIMPTKARSQPAARTTIADVARKAGVSKATVSRFLNHRDTLLSRDIAARVEAAVSALGYSPSPMAQSLKRGRSRLIGLIVADVTNPFSVAVLRGVEKACQEAGYVVMLFNLGNDAGREREAIATLSSYQVEGFLLHTFGRDAGAMTEAARHGKPAVLIDRRHSNMQTDFVSLDNAGAMEMGVSHLVAAGYREILFVTEPVQDVSPRAEREVAFRACIGAQASDVRGTTCENTQADSAGLEAALRALRARASNRRPAVLTGNAVITLRVAAAMARLGWQFGSDIGLVGFDETDWAPLVRPGLTTIAQPTDDLGRMAARCLIERLQGLKFPPRQILLSGTLIERDSSRHATE